MRSLSPQKKRLNVFKKKEGWIVYLLRGVYFTHWVYAVEGKFWYFY